MEPRRSPTVFIIFALLAGVASWAAWGRGAPTPSVATAPAARSQGDGFHLPALPSFPSTWFRPRPHPPKRDKPAARPSAPVAPPESPPSPPPAPPETAGKPV